MITDYASHLDHRRTPLRRRRRSLLLGAATAVAGIAAFSQVAYGGGTATTTTVMVHPGDTLWSIAASHYPGDDVQARIADILEANHLHGSAIHAGETLTLPSD